MKQKTETELPSKKTSDITLNILQYFAVPDNAQAVGKLVASLEVAVADPDVYLVANFPKIIETLRKAAPEGSEKALVEQSRRFYLLLDTLYKSCKSKGNIQKFADLLLHPLHTDSSNNLFTCISVGGDLYLMDALSEFLHKVRNSEDAKYFTNLTPAEQNHFCIAPLDRFLLWYKENADFLLQKSARENTSKESWPERSKYFKYIDHLVRWLSRLSLTEQFEYLYAINSVLMAEVCAADGAPATEEKSAASGVEKAEKRQAYLANLFEKVRTENLAEKDPISALTVLFGQLQIELRKAAIDTDKIVSLTDEITSIMSARGLAFSAPDIMFGKESCAETAFILTEKEIRDMPRYEAVRNSLLKLFHPRSPDAIVQPSPILWRAKFKENNVHLVLALHMGRKNTFEDIAELKAFISAVNVVAPFLSLQEQLLIQQHNLVFDSELKKKLCERKELDEKLPSSRAIYWIENCREIFSALDRTFLILNRLEEKERVKAKKLIRSCVSALHGIFLKNYNEIGLSDGDATRYNKNCLDYIRRLDANADIANEILGIVAGYIHSPELREDFGESISVALSRALDPKLPELFAGENKFFELFVRQLSDSDLEPAIQSRILRELLGELEVHFKKHNLPQWREWLAARKNEDNSTIQHYVASNAPCMIEVLRDYGVPLTSPHDTNNKTPAEYFLHTVYQNVNLAIKKVKLNSFEEKRAVTFDDIERVWGLRNFLLQKQNELFFPHNKDHYSDFLAQYCLEETSLNCLRLYASLPVAERKMNQESQELMRTTKGRIEDLIEHYRVHNKPFEYTVMLALQYEFFQLVSRFPDLYPVDSLAEETQKNNSALEFMERKYGLVYCTPDVCYVGNRGQKPSFISLQTLNLIEHTERMHLPLPAAEMSSGEKVDLLSSLQEHFLENLRMRRNIATEILEQRLENYAALEKEAETFLEKEERSLDVKSLVKIHHQIIRQQGVKCMISIEKTAGKNAEAISPFQLVDKGRRHLKLALEALKKNDNSLGDDKKHKLSYSLNESFLALLYTASKATNLTPQNSQAIGQEIEVFEERCRKLLDQKRAVLNKKISGQRAIKAFIGDVVSKIVSGAVYKAEEAKSEKTDGVPVVALPQKQEQQATKPKSAAAQLHNYLDEKIMLLNQQHDALQSISKIETEFLDMQKKIAYIARQWVADATKKSPDVKNVDPFLEGLQQGLATKTGRVAFSWSDSVRQNKDEELDALREKVGSISAQLQQKLQKYSDLKTSFEEKRGSSKASVNLPYRMHQEAEMLRITLEQARELGEGDDVSKVCYTFGFQIGLRSSGVRNSPQRSEALAAR